MKIFSSQQGKVHNVRSPRKIPRTAKNSGNGVREEKKSDQSKPAQTCCGQGDCADTVRPLFPPTSMGQKVTEGERMTKREGARLRRE